MSEQNKNFTKKYKPLKKEQAEILKLENTMTELKNSVEIYNSRFDQGEERISER